LLTGVGQLELLYGEAVTRADMDGESIEEQRCLQKERERRQRAQVWGREGGREESKGDKECVQGMALTLR